MRRCPTFITFVDEMKGSLANSALCKPVSAHNKGARVHSLRTDCRQSAALKNNARSDHKTMRRIGKRTIFFSDETVQRARREKGVRKNNNLRLSTPCMCRGSSGGGGEEYRGPTRFATTRVKPYCDGVESPDIRICTSLRNDKNNNNNNRKPTAFPSSVRLLN